MPSFYVTARGGPLIVRDSASGKIVGQLRPPPGTSLPVVAAAAGHTFVTAVQSVTRQRCTARLYRFRLNGLGQPGPLTPLHVTVVGNFNVYGGFAVTPDARTIAMSTGWCDHGIEQVRVINLATGLVKTWTGPVPSGSDLSLSADGRLLVFGDLRNDTRLLRTSAPAGSLIANSRTVSPGMAWGAFVGDGASMYGCTVSPTGQLVRWGTVTYYRYSVATGRKMTLFSWRHLEWPYCAATVDPSGSYLLAQRPMIVPNYAGWQVPYTVNGYTGRITRIPVPASDGPVEIAW
jgi:hypothetical protein